MERPASTKSYEDFVRNKASFSTKKDNKFYFATSKESLKECQDSLAHCEKTRYQKESE